MKIGWGVTLCSSIALVGLQPPFSDTQVFRSSGEAVVVPVTVTHRGKAVSGLRAADFQLKDSGRVQMIADVRADDIPLDLTLVIDTSGSTSKVIGTLKQTAHQIRQALQGNDQFRLFSFDAVVRQVVPLSGVTAGGGGIDGLAPGSASAVHDAILVGLLQPVEPGRRHLVVVLTDAMDNMSTASARELSTIAQRSLAVVYLGKVRTQPSESQRTAWMPFREFEPRALEELAEQSGGSAQDLGGWGRGIVDAVTDYIANYRQSYVLQFIPDSASPGWHSLEILVTKHPEYTVRARRGYFGLAR